MKINITLDMENAKDKLAFEIIQKVSDLKNYYIFSQGELVKLNQLFSGVCSNQVHRDEYYQLKHDIFTIFNKAIKKD